MTPGLECWILLLGGLNLSCSFRICFWYMPQSHWLSLAQKILALNAKNSKILSLPKEARQPLKVDFPISDQQSLDFVTPDESCIFGFLLINASPKLHYKRRGKQTKEATYPPLWDLETLKFVGYFFLVVQLSLSSPSIILNLDPSSPRYPSPSLHYHNS